MIAADGFNTSSSNLCNSSINDCSSPGMLLTSDLRPWYTAAGVIIATACLLGIPANVTILVKLGRRLRHSSISQRLFFTLAMSDLLCLLCLPVAVLIFSKGPRLPHGVCLLLFYFFFFCMTTDLNVLVLISIQRYYQVLHPTKWDKLRRRWQRVILSSVWLLGALQALPVVFSLTDATTVEDAANGFSCKNQRIAPVLETVYILFIVSSYLVLLSFYLLLVRRLKTTQMSQMKQSNVKVNQLFIQIIAVSLVFDILPLIFRIVYVVALITESDQLMRVSQKLTFLECFYFFNHCVNPFLYFFASRRQARGSSTKRQCLPMPLNDVS